MRKKGVLNQVNPLTGTAQPDKFYLVTGYAGEDNSKGIFFTQRVKQADLQARLVSILSIVPKCTVEEDITS